MPLPTAMSDLSATAGLNYPAGSNTPSVLDDAIRALSAIVKQNVSKGADIASASTLPIPVSGGSFIVTGSVGISALSSTYSWDGREVVLKFAAALTITHNATSLILPGGANFTTAAGDTLRFIQESEGNWRCNGSALNSGGSVGGVPASGGTMTGPLTLSGDATDNLHAVPKQQLEAAIAAIPAPVIPTSFLTGMGMDWWLDAAPSGWVFASGRTIGNAASGATERANADCEALFTALWNAYPNTILPVSGGRGASAAADWAANKTITLIDKRGRVSVGKDDMGGTVASRMTTAGAGIDGSTLGAAGGTQTHTLTTAQMPSHAHTVASNSIADAGNSNRSAVGSTSAPSTINTGSQGSNAAHQNTQPSIVCNYIIKL